MRSRLGAVAVAFCLVLAGCAGGVVQSPADSPTGPSATPGATTSASGTAAGDYPASATPPADGVEATVVEVVDGDTVKLRMPNGSRETARLLGVDTPEVHTDNAPEEFEGVPETAAGRDCLRRWGHRASNFTKRRLLGETVTISFDDNEPRRGYYGRLLVYIHHDGREFNYALVTHGLARVYDSEFVRRDRYYAAESTAMDAGRGLWTCRDPGSADAGDASPSATRTGTAVADGGTGLVVTSVHADAEGPDGDNLNDEYVVFENRGNETLDLSGWRVSDEADHRYVVPDGTTLEPGAKLILHTGSGTDTDTDLYWGAGGPIWNNGGDTVVVRDSTGAAVLKHSY